MKRISFSLDWSSVLVGAFFGVYVGYLILALATDVRIEGLREFVTAQGVREGVAAGVKEYERRYSESRDATLAKMKKRDAAIKKYLQKLDDMMDYKECKHD
jgi:hypothetical protein